MKRIFLWTLLGILVFSLTACTDDEIYEEEEYYTEDEPIEIEEEPVEVEELTLEEALVGVWHGISAPWEISDGYFYVIYDNGLLLRGDTNHPDRDVPMIHEFEWEIDGDYLMLLSTSEAARRHNDPPVANIITLEGDVLTLVRHTHHDPPYNVQEFVYVRVLEDVEEITLMMENYREAYVARRRGNVQVNAVEAFLFNEVMQAFEEEHAVSLEQERLLAFSPFLMMLNFESPRVFAIHCMWSGNNDCAGDILGDSWNVTDSESALRQLEALSSASGQAGVANDIWAFIKSNPGEFLDPEIGFDLNQFENVILSASNQVNEVIEILLEDDELDAILLMLALQGVDIEGDWQGELHDMLIYYAVSDRVNSGIQAFERASSMLIQEFGFTERELMEIETLAAWDYGRVSIIARYGVAAGFIEEDVAWEHLQLAANRAVESYDNWREYAAAHILGRAIAFGNDSRDMRDVLEVLFEHEYSPFQRHDFNAD